MAADIETIEAEGVVELHLNRSDKKNALTAAMYAALSAALTDASRRPEVRAVMIAGKGDSFCAGIDLAGFLAGSEGGGAGLAFIRRLVTFDKPIVAAVQGAAIGIGTTMLFHCDLVYAAPSAVFATPFVDLGLVPEAGASLLAPAVMGYAKAAQMLLLGEPLDAEAADRAGLVSAIIPGGDLLDHARAKARDLARKPPRALAHTRRLLRADQRGLAARIEEEAQLFHRALRSPEAQAAFSAFFAKRARSR